MMKELFAALNHLVLTGDPMRRSAAVLLLAYLNRDHSDRVLALACVNYLGLQQETWGRI